MARRRTTRKRSRGRSSRAIPSISLRMPRMPELQQRDLDLIGLGLVALAAFFAFVFYLGWDGGKVGGALGDASRFLFGGVAYLVPVVMLGAGALLLLGPMLPSVRPFRAGAICVLAALMLGLAGGLFGLGPAQPPRHGFMHAEYFRHHGGVIGEVLYWSAKTLIQRFGAYIAFLFLLTAGVMLLTGASVAGLVRGTRDGFASSARRVRRSTSEFAALVAGREPHGTSGDRTPDGDEQPRAAVPDVEPLVRATHVEAPALDDEDRDEPEREEPQPDPEPASAPFPRSERAKAEHAEAAPEDLTRQGNRRSDVTEAADVEYG